jgi:hypothetical protein
VLFAICVFLVPIFFTSRNLSTWPTRLRYTGEESYEGVALAEMTRLGHGEPIYASGAADRFDAATYGPLYYLLGKRSIFANPSIFLRMLSRVGMLGAAGCGLLAFWLTRSYHRQPSSSAGVPSYGIRAWITAHGPLR